MSGWFAEGPPGRWPPSTSRLSLSFVVLLFVSLSFVCSLVFVAYDPTGWRRPAKLPAPGWSERRIVHAPLSPPKSERAQKRPLALSKGGSVNRPPLSLKHERAQKRPLVLSDTNGRSLAQSPPLSPKKRGRQSAPSFPQSREGAPIRPSIPPNPPTPYLLLRLTTPLADADQQSTLRRDGVNAGL